MIMRTKESKPIALTAAYIGGSTSTVLRCSGIIKLIGYEVGCHGKVARLSNACSGDVITLCTGGRMSFDGVDWI